MTRSSRFLPAVMLPVASCRVLPTLAMALCLCGCPAPDADPGRRRGPYRRGLERAVLEAVNRERENHALRRLKPDPRLQRLARRHSDFMARQEKLTHVEGRRGPIGKRVQAARIPWSLVGENVARNRDFDDPAREAVRGWLASPPHRRNILNGDFQATGVGVVYCPESGYYYLTQVFLRRPRE